MIEIALDPNARFEKALVRLIRSFNYLDTNVGLCISHLENPSDPVKSYPSLANMTAEQRINRLKRLFESHDIAVEDDARAELVAWYARAAKARATRNRYVHGNWEYLPLRHEKPVGVSAPVWMKKKLGPLATETMSLDELDAVADEVEAALHELTRLRKKHGV